MGVSEDEYGQGDIPDRYCWCSSWSQSTIIIVIRNSSNSGCAVDGQVWVQFGFFISLVLGELERVLEVRQIQLKAMVGLL
jgi:hypothetical protein